MIYLSLSSPLPGMLSLSMSPLSGPVHSLGSASAVAPPFLFVAVHRVAAPGSDNVFLEYALPLPVLFPIPPALDFLIFYTDKTEISFLLSCLEASPDSSYSVLVADPVPVLLSLSSGLPFSLPASGWSFAYFPPPADYYVSLSADMSPVFSFLSPVVSYVSAAPVFIDLSVLLPGLGVSGFLSVDFSSLFTLLFPWVPVPLDFSVSDILEGLGFALADPSIPSVSALSLPSGPAAPSFSAALIAPSFSPLASDLPSFSAFSVSVSPYVYSTYQVSVALPLPSFPVAPGVSFDGAGSLLTESFSAQLPPFSAFSVSSFPSLVPGVAASLSLALPGFSFDASAFPSFGSGGSFAYFSLFWSAVVDPPFLFIAAPTIPLFYSVPSLPVMSLGLSAPVHGAAVWRVGLASLNISIFGRAF